MKTIKFFSLAVLLSLAWVACKDTTNASTETTTAEAVADSTFVAAKTAAAANLTLFKDGVTAKIAELEGSLATADDAAKATINTQLETYKKLQADLDAAAVKVSEATAETWATVSADLEAVHFAVKSALTGADASADQIAK
ncbi:MAG TPA: hypothetical protein VLA46_09425 [Saprospiraceae bacterium]|nr:hypothetical protein [Saprospiraceae bacterium]